MFWLPGVDATTGLTPNVRAPSLLEVSLHENLTDVNLIYKIPHGLRFWPWCDYWKEPQHILFQLANAFFLFAYLSKTSTRGTLFMHTLLILGFVLFGVWSWKVICAPDYFCWSFAFMLMNVGQMVYLIYQMRPVKFDPELEEVYQNLFAPFKVTRVQFKHIVGAQFAEVMSLHAGEAYAVQNLTKIDRLGLLLSGKVNVLSGHQFLHPILPCEFLDSPEFETSRTSGESRFNVSIVAASSCRYLFWQRAALEYLFVKEPYIASVLTTLIARDITTKLYAMNNKIVTQKGSHLDIRLPSITSSLTSSSEYKSPCKRKNATNAWLMSPATRHAARISHDDSHDSSISFLGTANEHSLINNDNCSVLKEVESLERSVSQNDFASNDADSLLESKFNSCELLEADEVDFIDHE